jgi:hypothetical protein
MEKNKKGQEEGIEKKEREVSREEGRISPLDLDIFLKMSIRTLVFYHFLLAHVIN